ncbi:MAG: UTP--glucose-1-phosphate uridylyltransferase [Mycoplasmataceae bacterium]|nr:UTP--glucose-1-phosphate uridylyltransferase [Mycoplasmataceae bacterium]
MSNKFPQIKKLIIPAAGWGTRFLPMTKIIPKELVPILNRPSIDLLVDEAIDSGIEEIILVISTRKQEIMKYFEPNILLENELKSKQKHELLKKIRKTNREAVIRVVYQYEQLGLGHAILVGAKFFNDEPFAVILGDDLIQSDVPVTKQLMNMYAKCGSSILGVQEVEENDLNKYGIIIPKLDEEKNNNFFEIKGAVEKPEIKNAPSNKAVLGRYIFNYSIVKHLEKKLKNLEEDKELDIVDTFADYMKEEKIFAYEFEGIRFDLGSIKGFALATIHYALKNEEIGGDIKSHILKLAKAMG